MFLKVRLLLLLLVLFVPVVVQAQTGMDRAALRKAAEMPSISVTVGFGFKFSNNDLGAWDSEASPENSVAILRQQMNGGAGDALRYETLAHLYHRLSKTVESTAAYARAATLYRAQAAKEPTNGLLLAHLGACLGSEKGGEGEALLRKAVTLAPKEPFCWYTLGSLLSGEVEGILNLHLSGELPDDPSGYAKALQSPPSPSVLDQAERIIDEARQCYDHAVAIAPSDPAVYVERSLFRSGGDGYWRTMIHIMRQGATPPEQTKAKIQEITEKAVLSSESNADLWRAANLLPNRFRPTAIAALSDIVKLAYTLNKENHASKMDSSGWKNYPPAVRQRLEIATTRLQKLAYLPDAEVATGAGAASTVGLLSYFKKDYPAAEKALKRAITLDPQNTTNAEMLVSIFITQEENDNAIPVAESLVRLKDSPHNRLILAKIYFKSERFDQAIAALQKGLKQNPDDFDLNCALIAARIRQSDGGANAPDVRDALTRTMRQAQTDTPSRDQKILCLVLSSIAAAFQGRGAESRATLNQVLTVDKENQSAKNALAALGSPAPEPVGNK